MIIPIVQFILTKGVGEASIRHLLAFAESSGTASAHAICAEAVALTSELKIKKDIADAIVNSKEKAIQLYEILKDKGINLIWCGQPDYPIYLQNVLKEDAPPYLFVKGNLDLLKKVGVGFCGARKSSENGLHITAQCAEILVGAGISVISGYAKGVDLTAHSTAMRTGGDTIIVLAEGILRFTEKLEVKDYFTEKNHLIISQFPPNLAWIARNAMRRNHLIVGISDAMILIEAGITGGTFAAGEATLFHKQPLFVVDYENPPESASGNFSLFMKGGILLRGNAQGIPNLKRVIEKAKSQFQKNSIPEGVKDSLF